MLQYKSQEGGYKDKVPCKEDDEEKNWFISDADDVGNGSERLRWEGKGYRGGRFFSGDEPG